MEGLAKESDCRRTKDSASAKKSVILPTYGIGKERRELERDNGQEMGRISYLWSTSDSENRHQDWVISACWGNVVHILTRLYG